MANVNVERKGSYQGVPQWGITGSVEIAPSKATAVKWAALENAARGRAAVARRLADVDPFVFATPAWQGREVRHA